MTKSIKILYKKYICEDGEDCKYKNQLFLCMFAHYYEEHNKKVVFKCLDDLKKNSKKRLRIINYYNIVNYYVNDVKIGLYQFRMNFKIQYNIFTKILSFLFSVEENKWNVYECKWCNKEFIPDLEIKTHPASHIQLNEKLINIPFLRSENRIKCNIGPICLYCALHIIPIRCDLCRNYSNFNNIAYQYCIDKDTELKELVSHLIYKKDDNMSVKEYNDLLSIPKNLCFKCLISNYNKLINFYDYKESYYVNDLLEYRYGGKSFHRHFRYAK